MSNPKFLVFKLKDLRIPALILLIVVALFAMLIVKNKTTQTFAPSTGYDDGKYIAGITLSDANMDLVVEVKDTKIVSITLSGLDQTSSSLSEDLLNSVDYINTLLIGTQSSGIQSLVLPQNESTTPTTMLLMDAVKIALSDDMNASLSTTYEKVDLPASQTASSISEDDIFFDEFQEEDFPSTNVDTSLENELVIEQ